MTKSKQKKQPFPVIHNFQNLTGKKFTNLIAKYYVGSGKWYCICKCGGSQVCATKLLNKGGVKSCGKCGYSIRRTKETNTTHGKKGTRIYRIWNGMKNRCFNQNDRDYKRYGAKGITVCQRWWMFENFYADMGEPPTDKHTLDRYPNQKGNYELSNCRWATPKEQCANRDTARGERSGVAKLTERDIRQIRNLRAKGLSFQRIGGVVGISKRQVGRILNGLSWNHI